MVPATDVLRSPVSHRPVGRKIRDASPCRIFLQVMIENPGSAALCIFKLLYYCDIS